MRGNAKAARWAAPAAFLAAFTVAVLLVRSGLSGDPASAPVTATSTAPTTTAETTTGTATEPETTEPGGTTTAAADGEFYEIQSGDTLETVAAAHDTTVEELLVLNPDVDPVALGIGQRIRVK